MTAHRSGAKAAERIGHLRRDEHAGPDDAAAASRPVTPAGGEHVTGACADPPPPRSPRRNAAWTHAGEPAPEKEAIARSTPPQAGPPAGFLETEGLIPARIDRLPRSRFRAHLVAALGVAWTLDGPQIMTASNAGPDLSYASAAPRRTGLAGRAAHRQRGSRAALPADQPDRTGARSTPPLTRAPQPRRWRRSPPPGPAATRPS